MERDRLAGVHGPGGPGSGYAVGGRLVLTSAHVTGAAGGRVTVFHPGGSGSAEGSVVWAGTPGGRDDAALVLVGESPHWRPLADPVRWGRPDTTRPGAACETWGLPEEAQRPGCAAEASHLRGELNPGSGFVGNQYVVDLRTPADGWPEGGASPWGGLSGAAVFCDRYLTGVVAADRARSGHGRLNAVPVYVLLHDLTFRANLAAYGGSSGDGPAAVEFQDLADPAAHGRRLRPRTPAALLEAGRQTVPFHGREQLLADLTAWCRRDGFGAWLLHGPGGQGKTRLAHHLGRGLTADGWTVLWPRSGAQRGQLLELRRAARPLMVVLDYAETRPEQLTALVEAAAEHPGPSPFKLLLLARTAGDWWQQARTATRQAEDHLGTARTHRLTPLEDDPAARAGHYRDAATALAGALPSVDGLDGLDGLDGHDWVRAAAALPLPADLHREEYGNALTLHMTALADLLDSASASDSDSAEAAPSDHDSGARNVEDRLLGHEARYWRDSAAARGLTPALSTDTLGTTIAAAHLAGAGDREHADRLWLRVPALADQPRDRRDRVTLWLAALYPTPAVGGALWGSLQPDRLAERHVGRVLEADPQLADHLLRGADEEQAAQLLTVYSRAAAHAVLRLGDRLTELCVRHHGQLAAHTIAVATRADHPQPLIDALDAVAADPGTLLDALTKLYVRLPHPSRRLAATAVHLTRTIADRYRALAEATPGAHLPDLAGALNNLAVALGSLGRRQEGLAAIQESTAICRTLADTDPGSFLPHLAMALNNLSNRLADLGRRQEGLTPIQEAAAHYRTLAEADPDAHLPDLAMALNNLSNRLSDVGRGQEGLAPIQEATAICRTLAEADPGAYLPGLATSLNSLSIRLGDLGRHGEGLAAIQEAATIRRTLAEANPDAYLPDLAMTLNNLSIALGELGRRQEALATVQEAIAIRRTQAEANPDAYLPDLSSTLNNLSTRLGDVGRRQEGLSAVQEATAICRTLAEANPDAYLPDLAGALNNLSVRLGDLRQYAEGLAAIQEATAICRTLAEANPDAYLPDLSSALNNLSVLLSRLGRREEGLTALREAIVMRRALTEANPRLFEPLLQQSLRFEAQLRAPAP
ncbi:tetratricopeptide repeat protein [Kitasatospora sp. NPDC101183]|uniref:tetratricopeptide repeat protein n=1 Tax=Kitasatospora sp. NPDC101183 TaxID=3364100 RepID=UPI00381977D5